MDAPIYLGDEAAAAGWRLAGLQVHSPEPAQASAALARARGNAPLVLLSASLAAAVDEGELRQALMALHPLVLVVPDLQGQVPVPDLAARLRSQLGLQA